MAVFQGHIMHKEEHWPNAQEFRPERFLQNGKLISKPKAFIPFSVGRRVCLGERLALADLFLFLTRFIQKTAEYDLTLHYTGGDTEPDPSVYFGLLPKNYEISLNTH